MNATLSDGIVRAGRQAREQFYDARGYGRPDGEEIRLAPIEAAHLLFRGDLTAVDGMGFREFLASATCPDLHFLVYKDLRDRGFYLSPARADWVDDPDGADLVVYPRGKGPWDDEVAYRVRVVSERATVPAADLGDVVLAVVDEESEITYLETDRPEVTGSTDYQPPQGVPGDLLDDRVLVWDPPAALFQHGFYGQPLSGDGEEGSIETLQLSLVEAAYLVRRGVLDVEGGEDAVRSCGREVEGDRFDRRLRVYAALRERGVVPKTGYKFGADFRTYADVESVANLSHSELLVRVLPADHAFAPRDLALDVRLAGGVRKRMVFALVGDEGIHWLDAGRLTP
ncbi:tRNA-intron lyase [Halorientalis salina]|uniref:tRNA-intron lyase n=1 Tax=Halorientalis salina TaxID=2932266 RepID=UPI0010AC8B5C|nr:tRNA-intron lyase [Halorientalis salina]